MIQERDSRRRRLLAPHLVRSALHLRPWICFRNTHADRERERGRGVLLVSFFVFLVMCLITVIVSVAVLGMPCALQRKAARGLYLVNSSTQVTQFCN